MAAFWDLCVPIPSSKAVQRELVNTAIKLGFDGLAWNHVATQKLKPTDVRALVSQRLLTRSAGSQSSLLRLQSDAKDFQQRTRLTLILEDQSQVHSLTSSNAALKTYDIVAVRPKTEKLFHQCCSFLECDIISLDLSRKLDFHIKLPQIGQVIDRGIFFEIAYAPAIRDATARRWLITNSLNLIAQTKGRNILITSEAARAMELRGPYDAINLGVLFGLKQETAKTAISTNAQSVLVHGATRRTMRSVLQATRLEGAGSGSADAAGLGLESKSSGGAGGKAAAKQESKRGGGSSGGGGGSAGSAAPKQKAGGAPKAAAKPAAAAGSGSGSGSGSGPSAMDTAADDDDGFVAFSGGGDGGDEAGEEEDVDQSED